ncbi:MAG: hypothetical protein ACUVWO_02565 [Thermodesulfobacteriota bacterium]
MGKIVLLFLFFILCLSSPGFAEDSSPKEPSLADRVGDVLCIRPLGVIRVVIEAVAYGVSLPITAPLGKADAAREFLITDPYVFTFERPLGEM